jgi:chromosome segregation ATPase
MDFSPHVTFISGTNGSGKSATLQALQCALGVEARKTGRATTQKGLIRTGADEATVRVTLWNKPYFGKDAFQHQVYGDTITVERRLFRNRASTWILKDQHGKVVARKRQDLDAMIAVLGINAKNPVTVMSQDAARSFLAGSSHKADKEKYDMYMQCTQLGQIAENLLEARDDIIEMNAYMEKIREKNKALEDNYAEVKKQVDDLNGIEEWRCEQEGLEKLLGWASVLTVETEVAQLEAKLDALPEDAEQLEAYIDTLKKEVDALETSVATKRTFLESFDLNSGRMAQEESAAKAEVKKAKAVVMKLNKKINELDRDLEEEKTAKKTLKQAAEAVETSFNEEASETQAEYISKMEEADAQQRKAMADIADTQKVKDEAEKAYEYAKEEVGIAQRAIQAREHDVNDLQKQITDMKQGAKNKNGLYMYGGPPMVKMVEEVNKAVSRKQFHRNPIGPVGRHLELTDPTWGRAVEWCLHYNMHTFLAHDQHDMQILNNITKACNFTSYARPNICVMNLDTPLHNVPANAQPQAKIATVYRVVKVTDSALEAPVMNYLVDQGRVESIALATNYEHGKSLVRERNVTTVFEVDGSKRYRRGATESHEPLPDYIRRTPVRLGATTQDQTAELEVNLHNAKEQLAAAVEVFKKAEIAEAEAAHVAKEARMTLIYVRKVLREAKAQADLLREQKPPELGATQAENEAGVQGVQHDIIQATQAISGYQNKLEEKRQQLGEAEAALAEAEAAAAAIREEHERLKASNSDFVSTFEATVKELGEKKAKLAEKASEIGQRMFERAEMAEELEARKGFLAESVETAEEMCSREEFLAVRAQYEEKYASKAGVAGQGLEKFFTKTFLESKYARLEKKILAAERQAGGSLVAKQIELKEAESKIRTEGALLRSACDLFDQLQASYRHRTKKFKEVDEAVEQNVNQRFRSYMQRKGHLGKLKIDRSNRLLYLSVQIGKDGVGNEKINDLKQLSGGERSYTTVAFTLALGSTTEMPFRALDEFDVFMDSVNRRISIENLLQFAIDQPDLQFIFLTPLDMGAVDEAKKGCAKVKCHIPDDFIKIVAMRPARDG